MKGCPTGSGMRLLLQLGRLRFARSLSGNAPLAARPRLRGDARHDSATIMKRGCTRHPDLLASPPSVRLSNLNNPGEEYSDSHRSTYFSAKLLPHQRSGCRIDHWYRCAFDSSRRQRESGIGPRPTTTGARHHCRFSFLASGLSVHHLLSRRSCQDSGGQVGRSPL